METVLKSGAKIAVTPADFAVANALRKALMKAMKGVPLGPEMLNQDVGVLGDLISNVGTSDEVEAAIFACGQRVLYEGRKFEPSLFDDPTIGAQARRDFLESSWVIVKENVYPFFETALSSLKTITAKKSSDQK